MPHATIENKIICCDTECVQPGTTLVPFNVVGTEMDRAILVELEFCDLHAAKQTLSVEEFYAS